jgi:hypothetical protein
MNVPAVPQPKRSYQSPRLLAYGTIVDREITGKTGGTGAKDGGSGFAPKTG